MPTHGSLAPGILWGLRWNIWLATRSCFSTRQARGVRSVMRLGRVCSVEGPPALRGRNLS
jgi:hypothetical protein